MIASREGLASALDPAIVIVDDDLEFVQEFATIVEHELQLTPIAAYSSTGAINQLRSIFVEERLTPRVIFLDLHMEDDFSGYRVLKFIRRDIGDENTPVVIISYSGDPGDIEQAYKMGATSYIQKPMDIRLLHEILEKAADYWGAINKSSQLAGYTQRSAFPRRERVVKNQTGEAFELARLPALGDYMRAAKLSPTKLARLSGVQPNTVASASRGELIRIGELYRILRALSPRLVRKIDFESEIVRGG